MTKLRLLLRRTMGKGDEMLKRSGTSPANKLSFNARSEQSDDPGTYDIPLEDTTFSYNPGQTE